MFAVEDSTGFWLTHAARAMNQLLARWLQPHGLTPAQWAALTYIERHPDLHQEALAEELGTDAATLTGVLRRLESRGLVERVPDPSDRRRRLVRSNGSWDPTAGAQAAARGNDIALVGFTAAEKAALDEYLRRIHGNITAFRDDVDAQSAGRTPTDRSLTIYLAPDQAPAHDGASNPRS